MSKIINPVPYALTFDDVNILPRYSEIESRRDISLGQDINGWYFSSPLIASPMDTVCDANMVVALSKVGCDGIIHRFYPTIERQVEECLKLTNLSIAPIAAIGIKDYKKRVPELYERAKVYMMDIDVAHGHCIQVKNCIQWIRKNFPLVHIMAGAVATGNATKDLFEWGANSVRAGVGCGSMCSTRIQTGIGVPQVTALMESRAIADWYNGHIICDGGVRTSGDIAKALAAGAHLIIIGSLFAGTKEAPGEEVKQGQFPNHVIYKKYRGSASFESKFARGERTTNIEGVSKLVPYRGEVKDVVSDIEDGVKSALSYVGVDNLDSFYEKSQFVVVSNSSIIEASPHGLRTN